MSILEDLDLPGDWVRDALCAQVDPELFHPAKGDSTRDAKRICLACPSRQDCLEWALARRERFGVYGGKSERERRRMEKDREAGRSSAGEAA